MTYSYDDYLAKCVEDFENSGCDGEPKIIRVEKEYEGRDADGNIETSDSYTYNCEECDCEDCEHYYEFHEKEEEGE